MSGEISIAGVFVPLSLVWAVAALGLSVVLRRILEPTGFYRWVWHRALFDLALFVVLWGSLTALFR